jgi:hypothetical protein
MCRIVGAATPSVLTPEFNFLHRGVIPAGSSIGHHFHNVVEEMFVILDGEAQFTVDGRTANGRVRRVCSAAPAIRTRSTIRGRRRCSG